MQTTQRVLTYSRTLFCLLYQGPFSQILFSVINYFYLCVKAAAHDACFNNFLSACSPSKASQNQAGKQNMSYHLNQASQLERQPAVTSFRFRQASKLQTRAPITKQVEEKASCAAGFSVSVGSGLQPFKLLQQARHQGLSDLQAETLHSRSTQSLYHFLSLTRL